MNRTILSISMVLALASVALADEAPAKPTLQQLVDDFAKAQVGRDLGPVRIKAGAHLQLAGVATAKQIVDGADRHVGYLFGKVRFVYYIDPADEPVVHYNLKAILGLEVPAPGQPLRFEAVRAAWMIGSGPAPQANRVDDEPLPDWLKDQLKPKIFHPPIDYAFTKYLDDRFSSALFADLGDGRGLLYAYDAVVGEEYLYATRPPAWKMKYREDWPDMQLIDTRPVARKRRDPMMPLAEVAAVDAKFVELGEKKAEVWATIDYKFLRPSPNLLRLSLTDEVIDRETLKIDKIEGQLHSVEDADGKPLPYVQVKSSLLVELPKNPSKDEVVRLKFHYLLPLLKWGGDDYWRVGGDPWFPTLGIRNTYSTFHVELHALKPNIAFGTGKVVKRFSTDTHNVVELDERRPNWFSVFCSGKLHPYEIEDKAGRSIRVVSYSMERPDGQKTLANLFAGLVEYYEVFFPRYPFSHLTIVEAGNTWGWGQAPTAFMQITKEAYNPLGVVAFENWPTTAYINEIFAHEIGHGWWGHTFRAVSEEDQWMEESFAEYSSMIVLEATRGKGAMESHVVRWKAAAKDVKDPIPIVAANRADGKEGGLYRQRLLYNKGPFVLHCLRSEIGDDAFFTLLNNFLKNFDQKVARTEDFRLMLEFITKKDWKPWFDKYVYGPELPEINPKWVPTVKHAAS